ncbi:hypothetical protein ACLOJK_023292 [Asimina triloba]
MALLFTIPCPLSTIMVDRGLCPLDHRISARRRFLDVNLLGYLDGSLDCARHSWFLIDAISLPLAMIIGRLPSTIRI